MTFPQRSIVDVTAFVNARIAAGDRYVGFALRQTSVHAGRRCWENPVLTDDIDKDGITDDEDNCPMVANPSQSDLDQDTIGDACDPDIDGDAVSNDNDNCPYDVNPDQADAGDNGIGDVCEADDDADGVLDDIDAYLPTPPHAVVDTTGCSIADICPCDTPWKNHGAYVACVVHTSTDFVEAGLITEAEQEALVAAAGMSDCGHKK